jgi:hypothetical protein
VRWVFFAAILTIILFGIIYMVRRHRERRLVTIGSVRHPAIPVSHAKPISRPAPVEVLPAVPSPEPSGSLNERPERSEVTLGISITVDTTPTSKPPCTVYHGPSPTSPWRTTDSSEPSGRIAATVDGGWVLNPGSSFPLTLEGIERADAEQIRRVLDDTLNDGYWVQTKALVPLVARLNIRCREIDQYVRQHRPVYEREVEDLKAASPEWAAASELDRDDLLAEFRAKAITALDVVPSAVVCDLPLLLEGEPSDATVDDALVAKVGAEALQFYLGNAHRLDKVYVAAADGYARRVLEQLVTEGLAIRGQDIAIRDILGTLKLKEMNELAAGLAPKPFRRKAEAVELLNGLPDIRERVRSRVAFRELFQLRPLPAEFASVDLERISQAWAYAEQVAKLLGHTYTMAAYATRRLQGYRDAAGVVQGWMVQVESDACPYCKRAVTTGNTAGHPPLVPLHIGCRCSMLPVL